MIIVLARHKNGGDYSFNIDQWAKRTNNGEDYSDYPYWQVVNVEEPQCESDDFYNRPCFCGEM